MEKMEAHNKYLTILESDLAKIKETLIVDSKNAKEAQHIGQLKKEMAVRNQHVLEKQLRRIREYLSSLKQMTELSNDIKVSSGYAMTIANMCLSDESLVVTTVAQAASGIEEAMEKIAILSSDVASIRAKASSEDDNTKISIKADKAYKEGEEAAKISEEATMSSLLATIQAADVNARFVKQLVDSFSNAISDLETNIANTVTTVQTNEKNSKSLLDTASASAITATSELNVLDVNADSTKEVENAEHFELGAKEANKMAKTAEKKPVTSKK